MNEWDDFADEALTSVVRHYSCAVGRLLEQLPPEGRKALLEALERPDLTHVGIEKALKSRLGRDVPSTFTIARHRRGDCSCEGGGDE